MGKTMDEIDACFEGTSSNNTLASLVGPGETKTFLGGLDVVKDNVYYIGILGTSDDLKAKLKAYILLFIF